MSYLCANVEETETVCTESEFAEFGGEEECVTSNVFSEDNIEVVNTFLERPYTTDNIKFRIAAMDCAHKMEQIAVFGAENAIFDENCVDVKGGEKAQIRIANPYTSFNITNDAVFENIEFTGEDLFANITDSENEDMGFMG